jgi:hypothetical protein|tara:strand:- start:643 stop:1023 length:381 start_codon:yes stop_codon:yes gene_type:complete
MMDELRQMHVDALASEVARLDRASKTADKNLKEAKEKLMAFMDEVEITRIETESGRAMMTLINGERLSIDWETLNETDPEIGSKVRVRKADLDLFRAGVATGMISTELADSVSKISTYRQVKVTRK